MDTSPVSAAVASAIPSDTPLALNALLVMAHVHGVAASGEDLLHRFSANGKDLNQEEWLLAARYLGLKVRAVSRSVSRLHLLALPAVVWQPDGQHFILARVDDGQFLIQDLAASKPFLLSLADFSARFSGQLILVASRASILGSLAKFDFTWFIPAVIKYRRIFLEVLAVSIVLQLFALITPLFFQVVMDKVLVHRGFSTLDVIAVAFVVVTLFEVVLGGLRSYIFAHTTSRIDVELGARLYRHLLQLPISYFDAAPRWRYGGAGARAGADSQFSHRAGADVGAGFAVFVYLHCGDVVLQRLADADCGGIAAGVCRLVGADYPGVARAAE